MRILFTETAWSDYLHWQEADRKTLARSNAPLCDIAREPFRGIGKPEPLKHRLAGCWSRRIDAEHRLVYQLRDDMLIVVQCRYHYDR